VQLFVERARRVRRDFSLADEQPEVIRICQLVEGMPLALELAASWTKALRCEVIAAEMQRQLNFLTTSLRNVPERHRSMQAAFDHSWQRLAEVEREVFKRLSVFRNGFRRKAAEQVVGATLPILSALVDKSLLRWEPSGRYQIHELLRQYAEEQLAQAPAETVQARHKHCAYYASFVQQWETDITGGRQVEAIREIAAEVENIRAAWEWAIQQAKIDELRPAANALHYFFQMQSRFLAGAKAMEGAAQSLDTGTSPWGKADVTGSPAAALAELLVYYGWFCIRLGWFEQARVAFEKSRTIYRRLQIPHPAKMATDPLTGLAMLANILGDYVEAEKLGQESRRLNEAQADKMNLMDSFYVLASVAFAQGEYEMAQRYTQQSLALAGAAHDRWMTTYILSNLGNIARALGDYAAASRSERPDRFPKPVRSAVRSA